MSERTEAENLAIEQHLLAIREVADDLTSREQHGNATLYIAETALRDALTRLSARLAEAENSINVLTFGYNEKCKRLAEVERERDAVGQALGLEPWDEDGGCWWLPADPAPIQCDTLADAILAMARLVDREVVRLSADFAAERERADAAEQDKTRLHGLLGRSALAEEAERARAGRLEAERNEALGLLEDYKRAHDEGWQASRSMARDTLNLLAKARRAALSAPEGTEEGR